MAHTDVFSHRMIDQPKEFYDMIKIIQRLSDAHQNDVGDAFTGIMFRKQHT